MLERLLIAGSGGQGIILIGRLLAAAAVKTIRHVTFFPAYGAEVRGGTSNCHVVLSSKEIASPLSEELDSVIVMNQASLDKFLHLMNRKCLVLVNGSMCKIPASAHAVSIQASDLANQLGMTISVCHFPPGTSKWNKIEHRMFCHITQNWRGRPLVSHEVVINLIAATSTQHGLKIQAELDSGDYPTGTKVTDDELAAVNLEHDDFHGEWNYHIHPTQSVK